MESHFNVIVPENAPYYIHTYEGPDDMPAHIKAVLLGSSLTIPVTSGILNLGTWQGIYLCEHRNHARGRRLVITLYGD
jgi:secondary thiamine-phosphate synthase enzyme